MQDFQHNISTQLIRRSRFLFALIVLCLLTPIQANAGVISDSVYVQKLLDESNSQAEIDPNSSIRIAKNALKYAIDKKYRYGEIVAYNVLGSAYSAKADYLNALEYYNKGLVLAKKEGQLRLKSSILYNMASTHEALGDFSEAYRCSVSALAINRKLGADEGIARCYRQIAQCMASNGEVASSIVYFDKAIAVQRKMNSTRSLAISLMNKSVVLIDAGRYKQALSVLNEAEQMSLASKDTMRLIAVYLNYGFCYHDTHQLDSALRYYSKSLEFSLDHDDVQNQLILYNNLGDLYLERNDLDLAETNLLKGYDVAIEYHSIIDLKDICGNLSLLYKRKGDFKKALWANEKSVLYSDSLLSIEKIRATEEVSIRFKTKEIESRNKLLEQENVLQGIKSRQNQYIIIGVVTLCLLISFIFFLYTRKNKYRAQKESVEIEQKLLQLQMNPHFIFNSLQAIQSFILSNKTEQSTNYLTSFSRLIRLILENSKVDYISLDKELLTLNYYFELQKLRFNNLFEFTINVEDQIQKEFLLIPPMLLQPFIENSIEHGFPTKGTSNKITLSIAQADQFLIIELSDNGIGMKKSAEQKNQLNHRSYAIEIIKKRVELLNLKLAKPITLKMNDLSDESEALTGTRITLKIPFIVR